MTDRVTVNPDALGSDDTEARRVSEEEAAQAGSRVTVSHKGGDHEDDINLEASQEDVKSGDGDSGDGDPADKPEKPEWVPEKFWDAEKGEVKHEELARSYQELEKKLGEQDTDDKGDKEGGDDNADGDDDKADKDKTDKSDKEDNVNPIQSAREEWAETGELSEETFEALEKAGLDRNTVETYINGVKAQQEALEQRAFNKAGGDRESYNEMADWMKANLEGKEIETFNRLVADPETMEQAVEGMFLRYKSATSEGDIVHGGNQNGATTTSEGYYKNASEMMKDINSSEYKTDKNFQNQVARKIDNAARKGINLFN